MRKSQWKPVPEQHQTSDGEQERPALTVGDLRKIFEPQKTNRPQRKNDDHGKTFEVRDQDGTGYKSHVLHSGVDQNRNVPNQEPQERSGRPALTVGDLLKIYEPQKTNKVQDQNGTGYKSHVLHLGADQNRTVPNKDILGNKIEPQERSDVPKEMHGNSLGKKENLSTIIDDLQKKIDKLQEKIDDLQKKLGELQKNLDKGVHDQGDLRKKLEKYEQEKEELQHKLAHTLDRNEHLPATVDDICGKFDKYEEEKEELQHKFDDLQKKCEYTLGRREQLFSATVDNICEKLDKYEEEKEDLQHKFDDLQKKWAHNLDRMEKLSATVDDICGKLDKCEHDKEELQHKFGDLQKICVGNILEIREQLSATVGDIWGKFEEYQHKFEYSLSKKEQSSSILEELQHQFEELQHQFDDHMKECEYCLEEKKRLSANIDDLWKITEELQHQFDKSKQEKERPQKIFDKKEQGKEDLPQTIEELQKKLDKYKQEKEELQKKSEDLQKEIDRRKAQFKLSWRESTLYPDWRKEEFQAVNVTLDEATAHPSLLLTEEGRGVTLQEIPQDLPSSTQRFVSIPCVLGQPQICSGRYYWEVKVGELHSWDLGVCRDNVSRKGTFQMSPQNGFWAIRLYQEDYWALTISETHLTLREKPLSVGIFLDYEAGDVSFYNMTDESHIFTFSKQTFYGVLRPLFRLWFPDSGPLTIVEVE